MDPEAPTEDLVPPQGALERALEEQLQKGAVFVDEHDNLLRTVKAILIALRRHGKVYGLWPKRTPSTEPEHTAVMDPEE